MNPLRAHYMIPFAIIRQNRGTRSKESRLQANKETAILLGKRQAHLLDKGATQERHQRNASEATRNHGKSSYTGSAKPKEKDPSRHHLPARATTRQVQQQQRTSNTSQVLYL